MKKTALPVAAMAAVLFICSCRSMDMKSIGMANTEKILDTMQKILPGVISRHVLQDEDYSKVTVIAGSPGLFNKTTDEEKQRLAIKTGMTILGIIGKGNSLSTGKLVFTRKDTDETTLPADAVSMDMKLDSLNKVMYNN